MQQASDTISRAATTSSTTGQSNTALPANCRLTFNKVKYLTKLKEKPGEDARTILREFHAKVEARALQYGCTPEQEDEIALQNVEMIAIKDPGQILQQIGTGLID